MNFLDRLICEFDRGLRTIAASAHAERTSPAAEISQNHSVSANDRLEAARLMRVNHCGEVCAQALYQGQALVAQDESSREVFQQAAREERDHLAWCQQRLDELGGRPSVLNPLWYAGSFTLGVASGLFGDKWGMTFLVETEGQVERHLDDHLARLPQSDVKSRRVLEVMREDEIRHGKSGKEHGANAMPFAIKLAMRASSRLMTQTAYWV